MIEQFSIECHKTKGKVITPANHKGHRQSSEPIKPQSKFMSPAQRENVHARVSIGFGFSSDWLRRWRKILNQSLSIVMQNQRKTKLLSTLK